MTALLRPSERSVPTNPPDGAVGSGVEVGVFLLALLVVALWVLRLLRLGLAAPCPGAPRGLRAGHGAVARHRRCLRGPADPRPARSGCRDDPGRLGGAELLATGPRNTRRVTEPRRIPRSRTQVLLALAGGALLLVGAWVATVASQKEWTPPPELALVSGARGSPRRASAVGLRRAGRGRGVGVPRRPPGLGKGPGPDDDGSARRAPGHREGPRLTGGPRLEREDAPHRRLLVTAVPRRPRIGPTDPWRPGA